MSSEPGAQWAESGLPDEAAGGRTVPAQIEVLPGELRPVQECSSDELRAAADARRLDAAAAVAEADLLDRLAELRAGIERVEWARAQVARHVADHLRRRGPDPS